MVNFRDAALCGPSALADKTANINIKKLHFIHSDNSDRSQTAKRITHTFTCCDRG